MPIFGYTSLGDMFDGGGPGASRSGPRTGGATGGGFGGGGNLLSTLGGLVGLAIGGPGGAALGAGLGSFLGGGNLQEAVRTGVGTFGIGSGGGLGVGLDLLTGGRGSRAIGEEFLDLFGAGLDAPGQQPGASQRPGKAAPAQAGIGSLIRVLDNPIVMAAMLKATEPKNVSLTSPEEKRMLMTGERNADYTGTPAFDYRGTRFANGGMVRGPGTGRSDSIPARIYQGGRPVREAALSDGEFVMTANAVRGAGNGDRRQGAAKMYEMMRRFEQRA